MLGREQTAAQLEQICAKQQFKCRGALGRWAGARERQVPERNRIAALERIGIKIQRARLPAGRLPVGENFGDRRDGVAAPALEFDGTDEAAVVADKSPVVFAQPKGVVPEAVAETERKSNNLLKRHRRGFAELAPPFRVGHFFQALDTLEKAANGPVLLPQKPLPILRKHVENENDDYGDRS